MKILKKIFFKIFQFFSKKVLTNLFLCVRIVEQSSESADRKQRNKVWRSRLVGRGRTIGNRVTGKTVREFESLLLRQRNRNSDKRIAVFVTFGVLDLDAVSNFCFNRMCK